MAEALKMDAEEERHVQKSPADPYPSRLFNLMKNVREFFARNPQYVIRNVDRSSSGELHVSKAPGQLLKMKDISDLLAKGARRSAHATIHNIVTRPYAFNTYPPGGLSERFKTYCIEAGLSPSDFTIKGEFATSETPADERVNDDFLLDKEREFYLRRVSDAIDVLSRSRSDEKVQSLYISQQRRAAEEAGYGPKFDQYIQQVRALRGTQMPHQISYQQLTALEKELFGENFQKARAWVKNNKDISSTLFYLETAGFVFPENLLPAGLYTSVHTDILDYGVAIVRTRMLLTLSTRSYIPSEQRTAYLQDRERIINKWTNWAEKNGLDPKFIKPDYKKPRPVGPEHGG